ncbi:serine hydrolase [Pseudidiomarina woesei]|uniref:CubicO group peptidase, beta-lactamase class C family n=1 Tax=Pseudidiomarina woesei TaxID=1381080 RepID=A0A0K6GX25_9GAMM|nr:acyl-CoA thioester hydrolase/BAAT C-terminal domain-containing protein [Pseudidiomarina woesei]CUA83159.1 CubicO group peptidase, beta-lactamase class C family [Pseudidiomarina woesei]
MDIKIKIATGVLAIGLLSGCNEPGYPEHLQVQRIDQKHLQGLLIMPKHRTGPLPTVIVLGGSDGGLGGAQRTATALADQGIAALAVGYFGMPKLPPTLNSIPLEYFNSALEYIDSAPELNRNQCQQVPVVGSSRGAELALLLGAKFKHYGPIIAISPSSHTWGAIGDSNSAAWTLNGKPIPFVPRHSNPDYSAKRFVGRDYFARDLNHTDAKQAAINVDGNSAQVLLFAGDDDQLWPADLMANNIAEHWQGTHVSSRITKVIYPNAGHVIAPGMPSDITEASLSNNQTLVLGGTPAANATAQQDILERTVNAIKSPICYDSKAAFNADKLNELRELVETTNTSSLVLMRSGDVVFEHGDIHQKHTIHSIRKPMLNALYGIYVDRGIINLDATLGELGITDITPLTPTEKQATVRELLQARSGVYLPSAATSAGMLAGIPERGAFAPGEKYVYNNWDFNVAGAIFEQLTGQNIYTAFYREIAVPLGMKSFKGEYTTTDADTDIATLTVDGFYQFEREKSQYPAYHFRMSAYDMALFGQLYENYGVWNGKRILSRDWIEQSTTSYSVTNRYMDFGYGMLWNVINPNDERPNRAFYHTGVGIHMLGVYPSSDLVFVHRVQTETEYEFDQQNLYKIISQVFGALEPSEPME